MCFLFQKLHFFGQQLWLMTVLLHRLRVHLISAGRPKACGAHVYVVLRARADELQGFWGQPEILETLLRNHLCVGSYPEGALKLMMQTQTLADGPGRTNCKDFSDSVKLWKAFSEIVFALFSHSSGALWLLMQT